MMPFHWLQTLDLGTHPTFGLYVCLGGALALVCAGDAAGALKSLLITDVGEGPSRFFLWRINITCRC